MTSTWQWRGANVFMRPIGIYRARECNVYGGPRVTDVPYEKHNNIWIANVQLVYVGLAQARPNYVAVPRARVGGPAYV